MKEMYLVCLSSQELAALGIGRLDDCLHLCLQLTDLCPLLSDVLETGLGDL